MYNKNQDILKAVMIIIAISQRGNAHTPVIGLKGDEREMAAFAGRPRPFHPRFRIGLLPRFSFPFGLLDKIALLL